jgi:hypothetical protein
VIAAALEKDRDDSARFARQFKVTFPVAFDFQDYDRPEGVAFPSYILIGRDGKVVTHSGFLGGNAAREGALEKAVQELAEKE